MQLQAVETQRLYQLVAQQIEDMIRAGKIGPGERLPSERELSTQLGVSRPSVREAMVALEISGLVEIRTGSGIYVSQDLPQKGGGSLLAASGITKSAGPFEILAARLIIEPQIAAEAARNATAEDIAGLWQLVEFMKQGADIQTCLERDREFHFLVASSTKNMTLAKIVDDLWAHYFTPMHSGISHLTGLYKTEDMDINDHAEIVRHIEARSVVAARKAMKTHLKHVQSILSKA